MSVVDEPKVGAPPARGTASRRRIDAVVKVKGRAAYGADYEPAKLLHARIVMSPHAHARILGIDASAALAVPGVKAVLTASDLPTAGGLGSRTTEPLAKDEVVFAGQPVALVLAASEAEAEDAVEHVRVEYEQLPAVLELARALDRDAPLARHAPTIHLGGPSLDPATSGNGRLDHPNVADAFVLEHGDVEMSLVECDAVVQGTFRTARFYQGYLEPQVAVAWPEGDGGVGVRASNQSIFFVRGVVAATYGLPLDKVRMDQATVGGGFGAKLGICETLVVGATLAVGRAVRLVMTRSEDFVASNPSPEMSIELVLGVKDDALCALRGRVLLETGGNCDWSPAPLAGGKLNGPYRWDAWKVETFGVRTNRVGAGAYRAPSAPQLAFGLETLIDELAETLEVDPIELRLRSCAGEGDRRLNGTFWPAFGNREVLESLRDHPLWQGRGELPPGEAVGVAASLFGGGRMPASAILRLDEDGRFTLITGYVDISGTLTSVVSLAADELDIEVDEIRVAVGDSSMAPRSGISGGSMVAYCLGNAVLAAARDAKDQMLRIGARELEAEIGDLEVAGGSVRPKARPDRGLTIGQIADKTCSLTASDAPIEGHGRYLPETVAPMAAGALAHVRVDRETGQIEVVTFVAAQDVGRALNRKQCEGQMLGSAVQAIGIALFEGLEYDEEGRPTNGSFQGYAMPRSKTLPSFETIVIEVPARDGPLGARGAGEPGIIAGAAAIANALAAATGLRMHDLPMTPARVWRSLAAQRAADEAAGSGAPPRPA